MSGRPFTRNQVCGYAPVHACDQAATAFTYCVTPLRVAPPPHSLGAELIWEDLQVHLDCEIDHQSPACTWDPTWTWGNSYPEMWEQAKLEWRGHLTLETLTALRAFGRMTAAD